jgi:hypothetical protein
METKATAPDLCALTLRVARPTTDISALLPFYQDGLGLDILAQFENHNGFDGVILGRKGSPYHFEFTVHHASSHASVSPPSQDNLLVFYIEDPAEWRKAVERMERVRAKRVKSFNPWWEAEGKGATFEDVDGWRVVLWCGGWTK